MAGVQGTRLKPGMTRRYPRVSRIMLPLAWLGEELLAVGKTVGLEEEAQDQSAVGGHGLVLVARRAPAELTWPAHALVILQRAFEHVSLLERGVFVQRHHGPGRQFEERGGAAFVVGIEHLDLDARKLGRFPGHVRHIDKTGGELRIGVKPDVGVNNFAWRLGGHGGSSLRRALDGGSRVLPDVRRRKPSSSTLPA